MGVSGRFSVRPQFVIVRGARRVTGWPSWRRFRCAYCEPTIGLFSFGFSHLNTCENRQIDC